MQVLWTNDVDVSLVNDHANQPVLNVVVFFGGFTGCSKFPPARPQEAGRLRRTLAVRRREARDRERGRRKFSAAD